MADGEGNRTVVLPIDASEHCLRAFEFYLQRLRVDGDSIIFLHVVEPPLVTPLTMALDRPSLCPDNISELMQDHTEGGKALGKRYMKLAKEKELPCRAFLGIDTKPGHAIVKSASEHNADLIVIGSRGLGTIKRALLGSKRRIVCANGQAYTVFRKSFESCCSLPALTFIADLGCSEKDYLRFVEMPAMKPLFSRCQWVFILLPGQEEGAPDWETKANTRIENSNESEPSTESRRSSPYPKFHELASDIKDLLTKLRLTQVVLFGEGLAANLAARVAIIDDMHVLGVVLVHCRGVFTGRLASVKDKVQQWRAQKLPFETYTEKQFLDHRFGYTPGENLSITLREALSEYKNRLHTSFNMKNLKRLSVIYEQRTSLTEIIGQLSCSILFLSGKQSLHSNGQRTLIDALKKAQSQSKTSIPLESIEFEGTVNPLIEKMSFYFRIAGGMLSGKGVSRDVRNTHVTILDREGSSADGSANKRASGIEKRKLTPYVRRQLSMAELDLPRGPAALTSANACPTNEDRSYAGDCVHDTNKPPARCSVIREFGRLQSCNESPPSNE